MADRTLIVEKLIDSYRSYFDVEHCGDIGFLSATAEYHSRTSRYVLVKRAQLWAAENHEYAFFYSVQSLDGGTFSEIQRHAVEEGLKRITPHSEHMFSYITAIVVADSIAPDTAGEIKRCRFRKNFKFSLHGWTQLRVAVVDLERDDVETNNAGKDVGKFLKKCVMCKE